MMLSGFWSHCSLFFPCPSWVSLFGYIPVLVKFIWLFLDYTSPVSVLPDYILCVYKSWVLPESWSVIIYSTGLAPFPWLSARPTRHNDRDRCSIILLVKEWSYLMSQLWDDELSLVYWEDERGWKLGFIWFRGRPNHHPLWFNPLNARLKIFRINIASNIA